MYRFIENTKDKQILFAGTGIFFCTSVIYILFIISDIRELNEMSRLNLADNFKLLFFVGLFVAPVLEEVIFRGYFISLRFLKYSFYVGVTLYIALTGNWYLLAVLALYLLLDICNFTKILNIHRYCFYILNSILFGLIHYQISDLQSIYTIVPVFFQIGSGLVLIWVLLNFGILKSILLHFLLNSIMILPIAYELQFPDEKQNSIRYNNFTFIWNKAPIFKKKQLIIEDNKVYAQGISIKDFYRIYDYQNIDKVLLNDSVEFYHYDLKIVPKNDFNKKVDKDLVKKVLFEASLIK